MSEVYSRLAPSGGIAVDTKRRTVNYKFSDESVGRDFHVVMDDAWQIENFEKNPIFLWAHDDKQPPIGRVFGLHHTARELRGGVTYAESDFAEEIFQLVRGRFLSAVSTSWLPIQVARASDATRPGGLDFFKVDLLEVSQVPIPALPTALATARGKVSTRSLYAWTERALDTQFSGVDRPLLEAVHRAARPVGPTHVDDGASRRLARARELQAIGSAKMLTDAEQATFHRYKVMHLEAAYPFDKVAFTLGMSPDELRTFLARAYRVNPPESTSSEGGQRGERKFTENDRGKLRGIEKHLASAVGSHASLAGKHDRIADHVEAAKAAHGELTSTLRELGYGRSARTTSTLKELGYDGDRVTRALSALKDSLGAIGNAHGEAEEHAESARDSVRDARSRVNGIIGSGSD